CLSLGSLGLIGARVPNNGREERQPRSGAQFPHAKLERRSRSLLNPRIRLEHKVRRPRPDEGLTPTPSLPRRTERAIKYCGARCRPAVRPRLWQCRIFLGSCRPTRLCGPRRGQGIIGELAPLLLNLAAELLPIAFNSVPIHRELTPLVCLPLVRVVFCLL